MSDQKPKERSIIRAAEAEEFSRWSMPEMSAEERERLIALARRATPTPPPPLHEPEPDPVELVEEPLYAEKMTLAEWEKIRDEAYQDGFNQGKQEGIEAGKPEGIEQGKQEGLKQAKAQIDAELENVKKLMAELQKPIHEQEEALHQMIMNLVFKLTRAMVEGELGSNPELLKAAVWNAIDLIPPAAGTPVLSLHPEDCELLADLANREGWELKQDRLAKRGDIKVVAGSCVVDLDLEQRFDQVAGELQKQILGQGSESA